MHRPTVIDFFSGCGGTSAGLRAAGMRIAAAVDFDAAASATYRANFPEAEFHEVDVRKLSVDAFDHLVDDDSPLVFSACAPCQPYSSMRPTGSRARPQERSLLLTLIPFLDRLRPDALIVENVPGLQRIPGGSTWNRFLRYLSRAGYSTRWEVVDCRNYGVPQRRKRLVLLASRHGSIDFPVPTHGPDREPYSTVRDWIGALPAIQAGEAHADDPLHRSGALGDLNLRRIMTLPEGGSRSEWPEELWLDCHRKSKGHQDTYGRMRFDDTAPVLTTKCTDITNGRYGHPTQHRAISVREAALLQTFPLDFNFLGSFKSVTRQIGNAVPVLVSKAMGEHISEHLKTVRTGEHG
ncbi:DNA cytosine methyltransferase [Dermacoccus abyssi]|uniref:DNA (cytosine-5-)-methyltransferase n=2 Tax=Dermacoccus TaxID=57495 RepID=A0A417Z6B8_9MICO|nr:DNA cytosine methyltransferase [Dermacoccus abyssi]